MTSGIPSLWFVGFSGHRKIANPGIARVVEKELQALIGRVEGLLIGHSSVAVGADQIFLGECERLGLPIEVSLPLPAEEFRKDFSDGEWAGAEGLVERAVRVNTLRTGEQRPGAYRTCGVEVVDTSDIVMVVWNGEVAAGIGGTGEIVRYARDLGKPLVWIHSESLVVVHENFPAGRFSDPQVKLLCRALRGSAWRPKSLNPAECRVAVETLFASADSFASAAAPNVRRLSVAVIALNLVAAALGSIGAALEAAGWAPASPPLQGIAILQLVLLLAVFGVTATHFLAGRKTRWLTCRFIAEFCRSLLATWEVAPGIERLPRAMLPEYAHLTRSLTFLNDVGQCVASQDALHTYMSGRVDHQIQYYEEKSAGLDRSQFQLRAILWTTTILAPIFSAICVLRLRFGVGSTLDNVTAGVMQSASVLLPVLGTSILSLLFIYEISRRLSQNHRMVGVLKSAKARLDACPGPAAEPVIRHVEQALMSENVDWYFHNRYGK